MTEENDTAVENEKTAERERIGLLDRRNYMRMVGGGAGVGAIGGLGSLAGAATQPATAAESAPTADTSLSTEERIEKNRTGPLEVRVENPDGTPVEDAAVTVEQQSHDFQWGTAVHSEFLTRGSEWDEDVATEEDRLKYEWALDEHFNTVVLENLNKWYLWEQYTEVADDAVQWAVDHDMDVRGHVCIWSDINAHALPPRVVEAMGESYAQEWDEADDPEKDIEYVVEESMNHIEEIITHYSDEIHEWEVVNEVQHVPSIIEAVSEGDVEPYSAPGVDPWNAPILGAWYEKAEEVANQYDINIATNTYNSLVGPYDGERENYKSQIRYLIEDRGVDLDGIGFQCHWAHHERFNRSNGQAVPEEKKTIGSFDEYAQLGARLRVTEFDMFQGDWDEEMQVEWMDQFMREAFSHPALDAFLMWGFWDRLHWGDEQDQDKDAPLYDEDWNRKPTFDVWDGLVYGEWWTAEVGPTNAQGVYTTNAFLGEHEITVETDQETVTETVSVTDANAGESITVTVEGDGVETLPEPPENATEPLPDFGKGPWNDEPHAVPGEIPAEEFDVGGQDVAYYDRTDRNQGGAFRPDAYVDIEETTDGTGYAVGWTETGEWLEYTTDVDATTDYTLEAHVASDEGGAFSIEADGVDVTGTVDVPDTGGSDAWETITVDGVSLSEGRNVLRINVEEGGWKLDRIDLSLDRGPYGGEPHAIPGRIPAEEFDEGGPGITYADESAESEGNAEFRTDEAVDIDDVDDGTGYTVGHIEQGEWLEYTVDVARSGDYALEALVASNEGSGGAFSVQIDGEDVTGTVDVPNTGDWVNWETVSASGISLSAGEHVVRITAEDNWWNLNYLDFSLENGDAIGVGDYAPQDSTGDGLYNDFDGDGETTHDDVTAFFENIEDDAVQNHPELFDFDENDRIGFGDVIELLRQI